MNRLNFLFLLTLCALFPRIVCAGLEITEIMYDPEGADSNREWIELYNTGSEDVVITGGSGAGSWRLLEESSSNTASRRTFHFIDSEATSIAIRGETYAVIAKDEVGFKGDFPDFDATLLFASISLTNAEGKKLTVIDGGALNVTDSVLYTPVPEASGTGASLQLLENGEWIPGLPTPGEANTSVVFKSPAPTQNEEVDDDFLELESDWPFSNEEVYVHAGENRRVFVDERVKFDGDFRFKNGDEVDADRITWAFGDGEGETGREVEHSYSYPGVYRVLLRATYGGRLYQDAVLVQVLKSDEITLGEATSNMVEIVNNSDVEVEVSKWTLESRNESKTLAEGTLILPREGIAVPFTSAFSDVRLYDSSGNLVDSALLSPGVITTRDEEYNKILEQLRDMLNEARRE